MFEELDVAFYCLKVRCTDRGLRFPSSKVRTHNTLWTDSFWLQTSTVRLICEKAFFFRYVITVDLGKGGGVSEDDRCDAAVKSNCESGQ